MRRLLAVTFSVFIVVSCGSSGGPDVVHPDGRVGEFQIDLTTEAELRSALGRPTKVTTISNPSRKAPSGRALDYRCGRRCVATYYVDVRSGRLSDVWLESPRFATEAGSRVGMTRAEAARREGKRWGPGCGTGVYIFLRNDRQHGFALLSWRTRRVDAIAYLGPHSVFYEGFC